MGTYNYLSYYASLGDATKMGMMNAADFNTANAADNEMQVEAVATAPNASQAEAGMASDNSNIDFAEFSAASMAVQSGAVPLGPDGSPLPTDSNGAGYDPYTGEYDIAPGSRLNADGSISSIVAPNLQEIGRAYSVVDPEMAKLFGNLYSTVSIMQTGAFVAIGGYLFLAGSAAIAGVGGAGTGAAADAAVAADAGAVDAAGLTAAELNRANHIFGNPAHNLGGVLAGFNGDVEAAYVATEQAAQGYVTSNGLADGIYSAANQFAVPLMGFR